MKNIRVRLTCFWKDDQLLLNDILKYCMGKKYWKSMEFVLDDSYDKLVILTYPYETCTNYDERKALTLLTEPPESPYVKAHATSEIVSMYLNLPFWGSLSESSINDLIVNGNTKKDKLLSAVTSERCFLGGHMHRLRLISLLDAIEDFDLWGNQYGNWFFKDIESYRGPLLNKYDGLFSYRYHFSCENSFIDNYFTEKISDPILAECLCFYDGCTNIEEYIDPRSYMRIDVANPVEAFEKMVYAMEDNLWAKNYKHIISQKKRLLDKLNPVNIIWMAVNDKDVSAECKL